MDNLEIRISFERAKNEILGKIEKAKEKWQMVWQEAQGKPKTEMDLIHLKLEIQLGEAAALQELARMEEKIKRFPENDPTVGQL